MQAASVPATEEFWLGDASMNGRQPWMSPVLIGLGAPVILGLLLAPQFLLNSGSLIVGGLVLLMVIAAGAYALSVAFPGTPGTLIVTPRTRTLTIVRYGMLANSTVTLPFAEVLRIELAHALTREHSATPFLHLHTRSGETWSIPADVTKEEVEDLRGLIRPVPRKR